MQFGLFRIGNTEEEMYTSKVHERGRVLFVEVVGLLEKVFGLGQPGFALFFGGTLPAARLAADAGFGVEFYRKAPFDLFGRKEFHGRQDVVDPQVVVQLAAAVAFRQYEVIQFDRFVVALEGHEVIGRFKQVEERLQPVPGVAGHVDPLGQDGVTRQVFFLPVSVIQGGQEIRQHFCGAETGRVGQQTTPDVGLDLVFQPVVFDLLDHRRAGEIAGKLLFPGVTGIVVDQFMRQESRQGVDRVGPEGNAHIIGLFAEIDGSAGKTGQFTFRIHKGQLRGKHSAIASRFHEAVEHLLRDGCLVGCAAIAGSRQQGGGLEGKDRTGQKKQPEGRKHG